MSCGVDRRTLHYAQSWADVRPQHEGGRATRAPGCRSRRAALAAKREITCALVSSHGDAECCCCCTVATLSRGHRRLVSRPRRHARSPRRRARRPRRALRQIASRSRRPWRWPGLSPPLADAPSSPAADADTPAEVASVLNQGCGPSRRRVAPLRPQRSVPTHPITRGSLGGLGLGLAVGAAAASVRRAVSGEGGSAVMSEANVERLASTLCRLRGAAMKVGQMLSFNDAEVLPPELQQVMNRVRDGADYMPRHQLERTLTRELGDGWRDQLASFDSTLAAAASIGQVHRAVLADGRRVAIKVQYLRRRRRRRPARAARAAAPPHVRGRHPAVMGSPSTCDPPPHPLPTLPIPRRGRVDPVGPVEHEAARALHRARARGPLP